MSLIERIKDYEGERARISIKATEDKVVEQSANDAILADINSTRQQEQEKRKNFVIDQTNKIITTSGVLNSLQQIDSEILSQLEEDHYFFYEPLLSKALLVWGHGFSVQHDLTLKPETSKSSSYSGFGRSNKAFSDPISSDINGKYNFRYITISIDPDTETLTINGKILESKDWNDKETIEKALFDNYTQPMGEYYYKPEEIHHDSSQDGDVGGTS